MEDIMKGKVPTAFLSSTCYDLRQIRTDLKDFFEKDLGFITNLEYISAKEKHISIYVFIDKSVMNMINLWKDNPNGNFNSAVDSTKVFEFIDTLRNKQNNM